MNEEEIIKSVLMKILKLPINTNFSDISMDTCNAWDSLAHMKLIIEIEKTLGITFTEEEIETALSFKCLKEITAGK